MLRVIFFGFQNCNRNQNNDSITKGSILSFNFFFKKKLIENLIMHPINI